MLAPSSDHPLPWTKRRPHIANAWVIDAANGETVTIMFNEATADFIVNMANAAQSIVWEMDRERAQLGINP